MVATVVVVMLVSGVAAVVSRHPGLFHGQSHTEAAGLKKRPS